MAKAHSGHHHKAHHHLEQASKLHERMEKHHEKAKHHLEKAKHEGKKHEKPMHHKKKQSIIRPVFQSTILRDRLIFGGGPIRVSMQMEKIICILDITIHPFQAKNSRYIYIQCILQDKQDIRSFWQWSAVKAATILMLYGTAHSFFQCCTGLTDINQMVVLYGYIIERQGFITHAAVRKGHQWRTGMSVNADMPFVHDLFDTLCFHFGVHV